MLKLLGTNTHPIFYTFGISPNPLTLVCSHSADRSSSLRIRLNN